LWLATLAETKFRPRKQLSLAKAAGQIATAQRPDQNAPNGAR